MSKQMNTRVLLASRPEGEPKPSDFRVVEEAIPKAAAGQVLCRTIYLSLDPYMRSRMSDAKSYAASVEIGQVMVGGTVSEIVESNLPNFKPGDIVAGFDGWQTYAVSDGASLRKLDPAQAPISTALGVLGMPGWTAYAGIMDIGQPKAGETVVVSAASGAVGSVVGQIAKIKGCRVVGVAGGQEKCNYVLTELGFDACINYKEADFFDKLKAACPKGVDIYFENVGGKVFDAVLPLLNVGARIPLCGAIAHYNDTELPPGPNQVPKLMRVLLSQRITIKGFIISDHFNRIMEFLKELSGWVRSGKLKYKEDIVQGLENAPQAFIGLLKGKNFGKLIVQVSPDKTRS